MKHVVLFFLGLLLLTQTAIAQNNIKKISTQKPSSGVRQAYIAPIVPILPKSKAATLDNPMARMQPIEYSASQPKAFNQIGSPILIKAFSPQGTPTWVTGKIGVDPNAMNLEDQAYLYLSELQARMGIQQPIEEFLITKNHQDQQGMNHIRMEQYFNGVPVYGSEVILHTNSDGEIERFNGNYFPTPSVDIEPSFAKANAVDIVKNDLSTKATFADWEQTALTAQIAPEHQLETQLVVFFPHGETTAHLAWQINIHPNITEQWQYMVDAHTGAILSTQLNSCKFASEEQVALAVKNTKNWTKPSVVSKVAMDPLDGAADGSGIDLNGFNRSFKAYNVTSEGTNFLIDVTRSMYNAQASAMPDEPVGGIFTINGNNSSPQGSDFQVTHLTQGGSVWSNPTAVSAHYNAGLAYEYYSNTFSRNSINGSGGTIISIINVADENGQGMDNAFWNGQAMFYGNGNSAFSPLAGALDVAGHEMSHGVIGNTANLDYSYESGAINESYADIFGAMIDRDDWKMGEDVVNTSVFPSGALRDLANPHNGATALGQPGWQPAHVNEQYTGSQDNGGVHINSGIPNLAYKLYATAITKDKAEQVYYKALTDELTKSSQFQDLRIAILNAATTLYGDGSNEVIQAANAFDQVGITGPSTGGGTANNYQDDLEVNPGQDFVVFVDLNDGNKLKMVNGDGTAVAGFASQMEAISPPSVTDNGSHILYVASDQTVHHIEIDWGTGNVTEEALISSTDNRNIAIAPDGSRLAVVTTDNDNKVWVYDFGVSSWKDFTLYNPSIDSTSASNNVDFADVLYFDYSGEFVMYDAQSTINNSQGTNLSYWDIGFLHVWSGASWADGSIEKLFSGLPDTVSVGNPTFAKNSPYIIAFDYITNDYALWGANIETGNTAEIATNTILSRPSFSPDDTKMLADAQDDNGGFIIATVPLASSKYEFEAGGDIGFISNTAKWGNWFANGTRSLTLATEDVLDDGRIVLAPNPFYSTIEIKGVDGLLIDQVLVYDLLGRQVQSTNVNANQVTVDLVAQNQGLYVFKVVDQEGHIRLFKAIKQ